MFFLVMGEALKGQLNVLDCHRHSVGYPELDRSYSTFDFESYPELDTSGMIFSLDVVQLEDTVEPTYIFQEQLQTFEAFVYFRRL